MWLKLQKQIMTHASKQMQFNLTMMVPQPSLLHHKAKDTSFVEQLDIAAKE